MAGLHKRSVRETVVRLLEQALTETSWSVPGEVPFGADPVKVTSSEPELGSDLSGNLVHVFFGPTSNRVPEEMGTNVSPGALMGMRWQVFVDVFAQNAALASDIGDALVNWMETNPVNPVLDARVPGTPPIPGQTVEFLTPLGPDVPEEAASATDFRRYWQVLRVELQVYYPLVDPLPDPVTP